MPTIHLLEMEPGERYALRQFGSFPNGSIERTAFKDRFESDLDILTIDTGNLRYTVLPQRGMDIGNMWYKNQMIGWNREDSFLLHPANVDLAEGATHMNGTVVPAGLGWLKGFYAMDAMVGPKHFGGPCTVLSTGERLTLHDRNSYSTADINTLYIEISTDGIKVKGIVPIKYGSNVVFSRFTDISCGYGANSLVRSDVTKNISKTPQVLDDGHHIQFGGAILAKPGARYASTSDLRPRDDEARSHPETCLDLPLATEAFFQERCYFLEPKPIKRRLPTVQLSTLDNVTVQMVRAADSSIGGFVAHKLSDYSKVTYWVQLGRWQFDKEQTGPIWNEAAIEPANSFPDDRKNKDIASLSMSSMGTVARQVEIGAVEGEGVVELEAIINAASRR